MYSRIFKNKCIEEWMYSRMWIFKIHSNSDMWLSIHAIHYGKGPHIHSRSKLPEFISNLGMGRPPFRVREYWFGPLFTLSLSNFAAKTRQSKSIACTCIANLWTFRDALWWDSRHGVKKKDYTVDSRSYEVDGDSKKLSIKQKAQEQRLLVHTKSPFLMLFRISNGIANLRVWHELPW